MARGVALSELVTRLRIETGRGTTAVSNADEEAKFKRLLARTQEFYKDETDWPFLRCRRTFSTANNDRFYDFPSDMDLEEMIELFVKDGSTYYPLLRGIDERHYNSYDSLKQTAATGSVEITAGSAGNITALTVNSVSIITNAVAWTTSNAATATLLAAEINSTTSDPNYTASASGAVVTITATVTAGADANTFAVAATTTGDVTTTDTDMSGGVDAAMSDPPVRWELIEDPETGAVQIEIWPVPSTAKTVYIFGKRNLSALTADSDTADLDDILLVSAAASEILARENKRDSDAKAAIARARFDRLKKRNKAGAQPFILRGGSEDNNRIHHGPVIRITRT